MGCLMSKELTPATFDYSLVQKDAKGKLINLAGQVKKHGEAFKGAGFQIGEAIYEAHEILAAEREGLFEPWVESETDIGIRTAYDCLNVYKRSKDFAIIAKLPPTMAYILAAPSTPDEVIEEVEKAVKKGARPTVRLAKDTLERFRDVNDRPKKRGRTSAPKKPAKLPSQSDEPPAGEPGEAPKISGGATFDTQEIEAVAQSDAERFAAKVKAQNKSIDSFARDLMAAFGDPPADPWLDEGRLNIAKDQIKSACSTIRLAMAHDKPCPKCDGEGEHTGKSCRTCRGCGYLPKSSYEAAGGQ